MAQAKRNKGRRLKGFKIIKPSGAKSSAKTARRKPSKGGCTGC